MKNLSLSIFSIIMTILFSNKVPPGYCGTEEFISQPFWYRYCYFMFSMFIVRCKYYSGWQTSQAGITYSGLNYYSVKNKETNEVDHKFDKILVCSVWDIEFNVSTKTRIQYWNRTVHLWLKYHVFLRLISGKKRVSTSIASLITFMISAIWHGFYPVYYLFFLFFYLIEQVATEVEQRGLVTYIEKAPFWQRLLYRIFLSSFLQFFGQCFAILRLSQNMNFFRAFYFVPNIILLSLFLYFCLLKKRSRNKAPVEQNEQNVSAIKNKEN
jgi:lysophospholipid acyltransferase